MIDGKGATHNTPKKGDLVSGARKKQSAQHPQGDARKAGSALEGTLDQRIRELRAWTIQRPVTAIVITAGIGFVLGVRWATQWHRDNP